MKDFHNANRLLRQVINYLYLLIKGSGRKIINDVFNDSVLFDMSSTGGGAAAALSAKEICNNWDAACGRLIQYIPRREIF